MIWDRRDTSFPKKRRILKRIFSGVTARLQECNLYRIEVLRKKLRLSITFGYIAGENSTENSPWLLATIHANGRNVYFHRTTQRNVRIMNPKNPDSDMMQWIHSESGYVGSIICFRILVKKRKIHLWTQESGFGFSQRNAPYSCGADGIELFKLLFLFVFNVYIFYFLAIWLR